MNRIALHLTGVIDWNVHHQLDAYMTASIADK